MGKIWLQKLSIEDRIALKTLLMQCKGTYAQQCLVNKLCDDTMSPAEQKVLDLRAIDGAIVWRTSGDDGKPLPLEKEVGFGQEARDLVSRNLAMLDEAGMLERMYMHLYELFVLTPWPDPKINNRRD